MEVVVLKRLQNCSPHMCVLLGCGRTDKINYMVMTLLGPNLSELRKQQPKQKFSISTTLRVGVQVIAAVRAMHNCGFLHRDIKPSNFAIGGSSVAKQTCYVLDFGLARQFMSSSGEVRPPRPVAGFRGTVRYASINAHQSKDLGRHDDLWSVFYLLVELASGELPWKKIRDKDKAGKFKQSYNHKKLLRHLPTEFCDFLDHLKSLDYYQEPNYVVLSTLLQNAIRYLGIKRSDPLDWEQDSSIKSLTTVSAGSAPALQTNNKALKGRHEVDGVEANLSTEECMTQNGVKKVEDKEHFSSNDENGRIRLPVKTKSGTSAVQPKGVTQIQQRRSMPPSPLLQATHLAHNDSGSGRAESLDRFFEVRVGEGRSCSNSTSKSSSKNRKRDMKGEESEEDGKAVLAASKSLEDERSNLKENKRKSQQSKSESETASVHGVAKEKDVNEVDAKQKYMHTFGLVEEDTNKLEAENQKQLSESESSSSKVGKGTVAKVQPDMAPVPQLGYTTNNPAIDISDHHNDTATAAVAERERHPKTINLVSPDTEKLKSAVDNASGCITYDRETQRVSGIEYSTSRLHGVRQTIQIDREKVVMTKYLSVTDENKEHRRKEVVDEQGADQRGEETTPSESSGGHHRLFACGIQSGGERVNDTEELLPLKTMCASGGRDKHSPGAPSENHPQTMWGDNNYSTQPMLVTHVSTASQGEVNELESVLPRPPDHPRPKHYTLLAARRKRFRRPVKS